MHAVKYFLGIDTSTTATKALLINERGESIASASSTYDYDIPQPHWSEQHPHLWWQAAAEAIRDVVTSSEVDVNDIGGIGLTGQMHGLVLLDENGEVLRPAILWNDQRTLEQCNEMRRRIGPERLVQLTGNDALTGFTAPKILWVQQHEPEVWVKCRHILLPKDYLRFRLTGKYATDKAGAAGTQLFDLQARDWSPEMLKACSIPSDYLPETFEGTETTSQLSTSGAQETGLRLGTPIVAGAGDQAAAAIGTGAVHDGILSISLGTSGVVFATTDAAAIEPQGRLHSFCHALPNKWHLMGVILSAAGSLRWFRDTLAPELSFEELMNMASETPAGSGGLIFLPYLMGERTPHADPLARGAFIGLTVGHTRSHMVRAVIEGVAFALRDCLEIMKAAGLGDMTSIRVTGGGARSEVWNQVLSNVFEHPIESVDEAEGACFGAAILAAVGNGVWPHVETACESVVRVSKIFQPTQDVKTYKALYPIFHRQYSSLRDTFTDLDQFPK